MAGALNGALNAVRMETRLAERLATPRKLALACDICTPRELAAEWANLTLVTIWHNHAARGHKAAGRRVQAVARVKAALVMAGASFELARELDRRAAK